MKLRWPFFLVPLCALLTSGARDPQRAYEIQSAPKFVFNQGEPSFECADRYPGKPLPPAGSVFVVISPQTPFLRTRLETIKLEKADVPALTLAAEPSSFITIEGSERTDWTLHSCAHGEGKTDAEARARLEPLGVSRTGSTVTLSNPVANRGAGATTEARLEAPADAPLTVHGSYSAVTVRDMSGPVRVTATHARAQILNASGKVDADAGVVDYSGWKGDVMLSADSEIDLNLPADRFEGALSAMARREVRVLAPRGFQTPITAVVSRPQDFICRAEFCPNFRQEKRGGLYFYNYLGGSSGGTEWVSLQSEQSTVVIDNDQ